MGNDIGELVQYVATQEKSAHKLRYRRITFLILEGFGILGEERSCFASAVRTRIA